MEAKEIDRMTWPDGRQYSVGGTPVPSPFSGTGKGSSSWEQLSDAQKMLVAAMCTLAEKRIARRERIRCRRPERTVKPTHAAWRMLLEFYGDDALNWKMQQQATVQPTDVAAAEAVVEENP